MVEMLVFKAGSTGNFHNINDGTTELLYLPEDITQF
jgi:hypothetical protein